METHQTLLQMLLNLAELKTVSLAEGTSLSHEGALKPENAFYDLISALPLSQLAHPSESQLKQLDLETR